MFTNWFTSRKSLLSSLSILRGDFDGMIEKEYQQRSGPTIWATFRFWCFRIGRKNENEINSTFENATK